MDADAAAPVLCRPAQKAEFHPALKLILGSAGRLADESAVVDFLEFAIQRQVNLNDIWVACRQERVVWAMLPMVSPGRTMLLLTPSGLPRHDGPAAAEAAGLLTREVCEHFKTRGVQLAQALVDPADHAARDLFFSHGFRLVAELLYLQADVRRSLPAPALPDGFEWQHYSAAVHDDFANAIVQSYQDSLDCPALNGLRSIDDVMAGHQASGGASFDPSLWFLLRERGEPIAALLLAHAPSSKASELVYLGLVPAARGRKLADLVMRQALHTIASRAGGGGTLALAVDTRNAPAIQLYLRFGMKKVGNKLALLRELHDSHSEPVPENPVNSA